ASPVYRRRARSGPRRRSKDLDASARLFDLLSGRTGHGVDADGEGPVQLATTEHLDRHALVDQAVLAKRLRRDLAARVEQLSETLHVDHRELDPVRVG